VHRSLWNARLTEAIYNDRETLLECATQSRVASRFVRAAGQFPERWPLGGQMRIHVRCVIGCSVVARYEDVNDAELPQGPPFRLSGSEKIWGVRGALPSQIKNNYATT
jgi:hypothetical protein